MDPEDRLPADSRSADAGAADPLGPASAGGEEGAGTAGPRARRPPRRRPRRPRRGNGDAPADDEVGGEGEAAEAVAAAEVAADGRTDGAPEEPAPEAAPPARPPRSRGRGRGPKPEASPAVEAEPLPMPEPEPAPEEPPAPAIAAESGEEPGPESGEAPPGRGRGRQRGRSRGRGGRGRGRQGDDDLPEVSADTEWLSDEVALAAIVVEPPADLELAMSEAAALAPDPVLVDLAEYLESRSPEEVAALAAEGDDEPWVAEEEAPPLPEQEPLPAQGVELDEAATVVELGTTTPARRRERRKRGEKAPKPERPEKPEKPATEAVLKEAPAPRTGREPRETREPREGRELRETRPPREPRELREPREVREPREPRERTHKELLVNVDDRETRIAVIEEGRLVELHVEREERVVGSIYRGRVANVLAGMDAAFVDIGLERNAFLYVGDILFEAGGDGGKSDVGRSDGGDRARRTSRDARIKDIAKPGQEILVQVVKGPRGTKGARVSTRVSLPGRFLVLMPEADHLGVSRKVEDPGERDRLRRLGDAMRPAGFGLIVRTEAEGKSEEELRQDLDMLRGQWHQITEKAKRTPAPALIHQDLSLILKTIRDMFGEDVDKMVLDSESEYRKAMEMLEVLGPNLRSRVQLHDDPTPLFSRYNIEEEIERLLRRKVWLRSGGYLIIESTEALTTIDVNTGKYIGTTSLSDTILKTNLDAVQEVARQLRLRDIGGMIVIDFIDMSSLKDRQQVMRSLENAFKRDRTRTKIAHISPLGLVEMTRKRTAEAVTDVMTESCPYCQGRGRVWSAQTMAIQIEREIKRRMAQEEFEAVLIHASPEVAAWLIGPEGENVEQLEREVRRPIYVRGRESYHVEKYEVLPGDMMEMEQQMMPFHGGQVVDCIVSRMDLITPPRSAGWVDGYFVDLANGTRFDGQTTRVRLVDVRRSFALAEPVAPAASVDRSEPI